jgi:hypothetical protein
MLSITTKLFSCGDYKTLKFGAYFQILRSMWLLAKLILKHNFRNNIFTQTVASNNFEIDWNEIRLPSILIISMENVICMYIISVEHNSMSYRKDL